MDKYEYKIRADEIKELIAQGDYVQAAEIADTIDWRRVKSVMMLCTISDLYKINRRYEDARDMLLLAYERRPGGRTICYSLCELSIKMEEYVQAVEYYKEFVQVAPKDAGRYVLQYKLYEAQNVSLEERIEVLEELKRHDYREKWAYELAYLYHRVGLATRCVEECDELILWFGDGKYVTKAMELKMLHQPLTPQQQIKYDNRFGTQTEPPEQMADANVVQDYAGTQDVGYGDGIIYEGTPEDMASLNGEAVPEYERFQSADSGVYAGTQPDETVQQSTDQGSDELDIHVKTMDVGQYNTLNLQAELAEGLREVLGEDSSRENIQNPITRSIIAPMLESDTKTLDYLQTSQAGGEYFGFEQEQMEGSEVFFGETGEIGNADAYDGNAMQECLPEESEQATIEYTEEQLIQDTEPEYTEELLIQDTEPEYTEEQSIQDTEPEYTEEQPIQDIEPEYTEEQPIQDAEPEYTEEQSIQDTEPEYTEEQPIQDAEPEYAEKRAAQDIEPQYVEEQPIQDVKPERTVPDVTAEIVMEQMRREKTAEEKMPVWNAEPPKELANVLSQESDGQISLVVPESERIEKQITGQMSIEDILAEWERMKNENKEKREEEVRRHVLQQTGSMFTEFEASVRDGLLEQLERDKTEETENAVAEGDIGENPEDAAEEFFEEIPEDAAEEYVEEISEDTPEEYVEEMSEDTPEEYVEEISEDVPEEYIGEISEDAPGEYVEEISEDVPEEYIGEISEDAPGEYVEEMSEDTPEEYVEEISEDIPEEFIEETPEDVPDELAEEIPENTVDNTAEEIIENTAEDLAEETAEKIAGDGFVDETEVSARKVQGTAGDNPENAVRDSSDMPDVKETQNAKATAQSKAVQERAAVVRDKAKVRALTREERELYGPFIQSRSAKEQLIKTIDNISLAAYTGNIIITGEEGMDTLTLAVNMIREVQITDSNFSGKVAKISGDALNKKDVAAIVKDLKNGALIIRKASGMNQKTAEALNKSLQQESMGIIVVLEDTKKAINHFFADKEALHSCFTARMDVEALSNDALVAFGRQYAREMEYSIDEMGVLALHTRVEDLQTSDHVVTVTEVKEIVDEAIRHANKKTLGHFFDVLFAKRYDDEDMIILGEKDFA